MNAQEQTEATKTGKGSPLDQFKLICWAQDDSWPAVENRALRALRDMWFRNRQAHRSGARLYEKNTIDYNRATRAEAAGAT